MPNHYELAVTYGVCGRDRRRRQSEAAIVKADWPDRLEGDSFLPRTWRQAGAAAWKLPACVLDQLGKDASLV